MAGFLLLSRVAWDINEQGEHSAYVALLPGFISVSLSEQRPEGSLTKLNRMVDVKDLQECEELAVELGEKAGVKVVCKKHCSSYGDELLQLVFGDNPEEEGGAA